MPRLLLVPVLALAMVGTMLRTGSPAAAPTPSPAASSGETANRDASRNAGTIVGVVTGVDYTPGKSKMVVKAASQSYDFVVVAGTNVQGPSHDFTVDVKVGTHVSVSASKSANVYTAQIIRVLSVHPTP